MEIGRDHLPDHAQLELVFSVALRDGASLSRKFRGTGVTLSSTRPIAKQRNGVSVEVESCHGDGARNTARFFAFFSDELVATAPVERVFSLSDHRLPRENSGSDLLRSIADTRLEA